MKKQRVVVKKNKTKKCYKGSLFLLIQCFEQGDLLNDE